MTEKQYSCSLRAIQDDLSIAISQLVVYNLYLDSDSDDANLSSCLIGLTAFLRNIEHRLGEYQRLAEIAPSVEIAPSEVNEEVAING